MLKKQVLSFFLFVSFTPVFSATVSQTLFINRGLFTTVSGTNFPFYAFNDSPSYNSLNTVIQLSTSDTLQLTVINNDTVVHGFDIKSTTGNSNTLNPGDTITVNINFPQQGVFIYYDNYAYPQNRYMGLSGMICVSNNTNAKRYFWNIKEHQTGFNNTIAAGGNADFSQYDPDYFTINGKSFPQLANDTSATVSVSLGDTIFLFVANTGQSSHSLHFHGFHPVCLYSSDGWMQVNSGKDTWPLKRMESVLLMIVPDKTGRYSVHDHNLVAVSGGGIHPNGMFTIMEILP